MMNNFSDLYAQAYDLLYSDKDYAAEVLYIDELIKKLAPGTKSILDLGCGTGKHDKLIAEKGYSVHGVDMSENMIERAQALAGSKLNKELTFSTGDIRTIKLKRKFDVVVSLFHVMSYQTTNEDLQMAFNTVKEHLNPGGIFIFDCWYGPGVLTDPPQVRVKRLENQEIKLVRIAEPEHHVTHNVIDVNYELQIESIKNPEHKTIFEKHKMRYLFDTEVEWLSLASSMKIVAGYHWLTFNEPTLSTWNCVYVCKLNSTGT